MGGANTKEEYKPIFDEDDMKKFWCKLCQRPVKFAVRCQSGDQFCLNCIGAYADIHQNIRGERSDDGAATNFVGNSLAVSVLRERKFDMAVDDCMSAEAYQHLITVDGQYKFDTRVKCAFFVQAIQDATNCCPKCGVVSAFREDRLMDQELNKCEVRCSGTDCEWSGEFGKFKQHTQDSHDGQLLDAQGGDGDLSRVVLDGKTITILTNCENNVKHLHMRMKYSV